MMKKLFSLFAAIVIEGTFIPTIAHAIQLGWIWTSAPTSAQVGDTITVSAKYRKSEYSVCNASFVCTADYDGWDAAIGVKQISSGNGTAQFQITSRGNGYFYIIAMADNAPNFDRLRVTIGSTSSSPTLTLTSPVSETKPGTTVTLNCTAEGGSGLTSWSISSPVADTIDNGVVQLSSVNTSRMVTVTASYSGVTKSVLLSVKAICDAPVIEPGDGTVFTTSGQKVVLSCATTGSTIRYTLDGSTPNVGSAVYTSPFNVTNDTTIVAFASAAGYYDSPITVATLTKYKETLLAPEIFAKDIETDAMIERHQEVSIVSPNNASIYYTLDGSLPSRYSTLYEKPICVFTGAHIKAIAILNGWNDSTISSLVVTNPMSLSDAVNCTNLTMESSTWTLDATQAFSGMFSLSSGACADGGTNAISCVIEGPKTISFRWKCSCEDDPDYDNWDYLCFLMNGEEKARIDGEVDWQEVSLVISTTGSCLLTWEYRKDAQLSAGEDCAWLDALSISEEIVVWPEVEDAVEVAAALAVAADGRLAARIRSVEEYEAFRAWIIEKGLDALAVKESVYAWPSFLLGAKELFKGEPVIVLGMPSAAEASESAKRGASGTPWVVTVTVKDGEKVADVDAAKVAALFECTGDLMDWSGAAAVKISVEPQEGEGMWFLVTPEEAGVERAFLRVGE